MWNLSIKINLIIIKLKKNTYIIKINWIIDINSIANNEFN